MTDTSKEAVEQMIGESDYSCGDSDSAKDDMLRALASERDALQAKLGAMPEKLRVIIRMTDEIGKAPMTADRWADRIEEVALEMIASIEGDKS